MSPISVSTATEQLATSQASQGPRLGLVSLLQVFLVPVVEATPWGFLKLDRFSSAC